MSAPKAALRLFANASGVSCLETFEISRELRDFAPPADPLWASSTEPASRYVVISLPVGWNGRKHPTPQRQVLFGLSGKIRITPDIGEPRIIAAGDILIMEDTRGRGHFTEVISDEPFDGVMVQLPKNSTDTLPEAGGGGRKRAHAFGGRTAAVDVPAPINHQTKRNSPFYKRPAVCHFSVDRRPMSGR